MECLPFLNSFFFSRPKADSIFLPTNNCCSSIFSLQVLKSRNQNLPNSVQMILWGLRTNVRLTWRNFICILPNWNSSANFPWVYKIDWVYVLPIWEKAGHNLQNLIFFFFWILSSTSIYIHLITTAMYKELTAPPVIMISLMLQQNFHNGLLWF